MISPLQNTLSQDHFLRDLLILCPRQAQEVLAGLPSPGR